MIGFEGKRCFWKPTLEEMGSDLSPVMHVESKVMIEVVVLRLNLC
jgi:hypothetical protein